MRGQAGGLATLLEVVMRFGDALAATGSRRIGVPCKTGLILTTFSPEERATFEEAVTEKGGVQHVLAALRAMELVISEGALRRHLKRQCQCS